MYLYLYLRAATNAPVAKTEPQFPCQLFLVQAKLVLYFTYIHAHELRRGGRVSVGRNPLRIGIRMKMDFGVRHQ